MEENKACTVKQVQAGDDSGYSCTSTQSKYSSKSSHSQSASSGDSCFEERRLSTLKTNNDGKMSTTLSKSPEQTKQTVLNQVSESESKTNQERNTKKSKLEHTVMTEFEPEMDQLLSVDELKQSTSQPKIDSDESNNSDDNVKEYHDRNNRAFLQLATLCQSFHDYLKTKNSTINPSDAVLKELSEEEVQLKEIIESNEILADSFGVVVSMNDGLIIHTSNSISENMGYPKDMWQGRSFIDFIHPKNRISFVSYVTSVLTDPSTVSGRAGASTVTFLRAKNNDGFYCNIRRYKGLNTGYSIPPKKNHYQVCKLTVAFKDISYVSTSSCVLQIIAIKQPQLLLIIKAQLIHSAYTCSEEKKENPINFITKHNSQFEWCYIDHLIISHFGYLPQNIIGKCIFDFYHSEDLIIIKEIHENLSKARSVPYKGKPYRFKCQNGDYALVQTEWSNFVNPWSGRVEFVIGRHKVIQGPLNPDVTSPVDDVIQEVKSTEYKNIHTEVYEDIKKIMNKNFYGTNDVIQQVSQMMDSSSNVKQQISKKCKDLAMFMNCLVDGIDPSIQVPLEVEVQPESGSFSDHDSVMLGEISPHHNYESKSSSGTPPSYTQLNYNDNIQRFFESNLKTDSSENMSDKSFLKEFTGKASLPDTEKEKVQQNKVLLLKSVVPSSSTSVNHVPSNYFPEQELNQISQLPLTKEMLIRHNKKMENDLVKQHKSNAKRFKSGEKQKKMQGEAVETSGITHGVKRSNSSSRENKLSKVPKKKHITSNPTNVNTPQTQDEEITATVTVTKATQIWPPCQVTRDSQTTNDASKTPPISNQILYYKVPLSNNVMPVRQNNVNENTRTFMGSYEPNQEALLNHYQHPLNVPLYATIPMMNHNPQNSQTLQPYLHLHNQLFLQPYDQNIQFNKNMNLQKETSISVVTKTFDQEKTSQVNQEEIVTSSDSECRREIGSLESSSFYSSSLRDKTDSFESYISNGREGVNSQLAHPEKMPLKRPFWMEDIETTPELIFRYQIEHKDLNEVLQKDMKALNTFTQPSQVNEQLKQLFVELEVNGYPKSLFLENKTSSSSGEDECFISSAKKNKKNYDFSRMAMIYEANAPLPPPSSTASLV